MYEASFSLRTRPFSAHAADGQFLSSPRLDDALQGTLAAALVGTGIAAVTGPAGVGKTAFCLELARRTIKPWKPVLLASARFAAGVELWQSVLCALDRDFTGLTPCEARLHIVEAARKRAGGGGGLLLIVDEAHHLETGLLEELRVLTSELERGRPIIRLVLSGQLELEELLALPELAALSQRLGSHVLLEPLTREESRTFIRQQVESAGGCLDQVFTTEALELICAAGDGNRRCLNLLCDHTLLLAYVAEERPASAATVQSALDDLKGLPLQWYQPPTDMEPQEPEPDSDELYASGPASFAEEWPGGTEDQAGEEAGTFGVGTEWPESDVAVIEFGSAAATTPDEPACAECNDGSHESVGTYEGAAEPAVVNEGSGDAYLAFDNGSTGCAAPESEIVETCVDDLYARLDRLMEERQLSSVTAAPPPTVCAPQPLETAMLDVSDEAAADPLEADVLGQIEQLHAAIEDRLADSSAEPPEWLSVDEGGFWPGRDDGWDVIEPESEVRIEPVATEPEFPAVGLDSASIAPTATVPEPALRVVLESSPPLARQAETSSAGRYAGLFTRLKRRRREAAEEISAGVSLTTE